MKTLIHLLALLFFAALCSSCGKKGAPIRIGINAWPGYEFLYLAEEKGFFESEGVDVEIIEFNSLADGKRSYERGQIDGLGCTLVEYLQILGSSNRQPEISIIADYSNGADVVLAKSGFNDLSELKGKTIGLEINSLGTYVLARLLDKAGLELEDVTLSAMDQLSIEKALCKGEIDAGITYPPFSVNLLGSCDVKQVFSSAEIPNEILDIVVLEKHIVENRKEEADAIIRAFFKAQEWAFQNPSEAFSIMGNREGITAEAFESSLSDGLYILTKEEQAKFWREDGPLQKAIVACEQILIETGQLSNKVYKR